MQQIKNDLNTQRIQIKKQIIEKRANLKQKMDDRKMKQRKSTEIKLNPAIWKGGTIDFSKIRKNIEKERRVQTQEDVIEHQSI